MVLARSEDDREVAMERARVAIAEAEGMREAVAVAEEKVKQVEDDLEVRRNRLTHVFLR